MYNILLHFGDFTCRVGAAQLDWGSLARVQRDEEVDTSQRGETLFSRVGGRGRGTLSKEGYTQGGGR